VQPGEVPREIFEAFLRHQGEEQERVRRFGHVRPPISIEHAGHRLVAVGSKLYWAKNWKTFHDFLFTYVAMIFGTDWGNAELQKPFGERHPIAQWYHHLCDLQARHSGDRDAGGIYTATATGPVMAYC
jgi:hypothetical protein